MENYNTNMVYRGNKCRHTYLKIRKQGVVYEDFMSITDMQKIHI